MWIVWECVLLPNLGARETFFWQNKLLLIPKTSAPNIWSQIQCKIWPKMIIFMCSWGKIMFRKDFFNPFLLYLMKQSYTLPKILNKIWHICNSTNSWLMKMKNTKMKTPAELQPIIEQPTKWCITLNSKLDISIENCNNIFLDGLMMWALVPTYDMRLDGNICDLTYIFVWLI